MLELTLDVLASPGGRGLELGVLPSGDIHAILGDTERASGTSPGCRWVTFDLTGAKVEERRFDTPAWLPISWKGRQMTALTESREDRKGHYQHRSRLVLLKDGEPETLDEFEWECYADRPAILGELMWIGVSRGVGRPLPSFAWRWDGTEIKRLPIGRKMDWVSTPIGLPEGVIACEVESFLLKEEQSAVVCFRSDGTPVAKSPWIPGGGEFAGKVFWIRNKLWVHTSRGELDCFEWVGGKLVRAWIPPFLGPAAGWSKDAPGRLALYDCLGETAAAEFGPELKIEWVVPLERGALIGFWSFRRFILRRVHFDGRHMAETALAQGGLAMKRPIRHPVGGLLAIQTDGTIVSIRDARGSSTTLMPATGW